MKNFYRFSLLTTIATYFLILIGGFVRVSGAGLGCPDWPTCFGRWIPPTSINQLPPDIDHEAFNIVYAWTEYINRLSGMTVGLLILIVALWAIYKFRSQKKILYPSIAAAVLTALQGYQGAAVVGSGLEPIFISVHMYLALIIVSLLIYVTLQASYLKKTEITITSKVNPKAVLSLRITGIVMISQIILGTKLRGSLEILSSENPLVLIGNWISNVGFFSYLHAGLGSLLFIIALYSGILFLKDKANISKNMSYTAVSIIILFCLQFTVGISFIFFGIIPAAQLAHQWLGTLGWGSVFVMYLMIEKETK